MSRPCPNCGAMCAREARFCRLCGTPLRPVSDALPVSPGAATVPLTDEGRTTNGLAAEDGSASAPETGRVRRSEMESILRRPANEKVNSGQIAANAEAPVTTALASERDAKVVTVESSGSSSKDLPSSSSVAPTETTKAAHETVPSGTRPVGAEKDGGAGASPAKSRDAGSGRRMWQAAALALLVVAVGATALAFYYSRRTAGERDSQQGTAPISLSDQQRLVQEKLSEAEGLLSAGNVTDAIARLRYAIRLDPTNARAHRLLAEALERTGAVNEAIDEYRLATQYDSGNEDTLMRYADALRRVGRTDEARDIYQKLSASSSPETARVAKEQLAALPPAPASTEPSRDARTQNRAEEENANTAGEQAPPASSTQAGTTTTGANGSGSGRPKNDPVESYNAAMRIVEGRDIRKMNRAELIRAYELFQYAQAGPNRAEASRRLRELDKELFERRKVR